MQQSIIIARHSSLAQLQRQVSRCRLCADQLAAGPRPVFQLSESAVLLVAGQAPGRRVHATGIPFNDPSGERLRDWMGIDRDRFYDPARIAILPMGFCYPGSGRHGDLPPRPECARQWREALLERLPRLQLTLAIGQYAIDWHLGSRRRGNLTETVRDWRAYGPALMPLPHPSPRNNRWLARNRWFEAELVPELRRRVAALLDGPA